MNVCEVMVRNAAGYWRIPVSEGDGLMVIKALREGHTAITIIQLNDNGSQGPEITLNTAHVVGVERWVKQ